jgi:hypothetical protein
MLDPCQRVQSSAKRHSGGHKEKAASLMTVASSVRPQMMRPFACWAVRGELANESKATW